MRQHRPLPEARAPSRVTRTRQQARYTYDRMSSWYDRFAWSEAAFQERGLELLHPVEGERLLEIGFGTGRALLPLSAAAGKRGKVVGVDLSFGMARHALDRLRNSLPGTQVFLQLGDALALPYSTGYFDGIFLSFTLELFDTPEIPGVLVECSRVLRPGGRIALVSLSNLYERQPMVSIYEWLHEHFPRAVDCRPIPARAFLEQSGFIIEADLVRSMWGLPVEVALGRKF